ncbi:MAG: flavodoxin family protein [Elusimicrobia bacterium]|nr:flavodoxin family protein [Elusimicrobiota bacterium]
MKILLISGSPRGEKSATYTLAAEILKGAQAAGAETEAVQLAGKKLSFCHACDACHRGAMTCPLKDDVHHIIMKMLNADGIVFATPNYINQVAAPMKTVMDRTSNHIHCQRFLGKYTASAVTSGSGHNKPVSEYIAAYGRLCGAQSSGAVSCGPVPPEEQLKEAFALGAKLAMDIKNKTAYKEQLSEIETRRRYFAEIIKRRKDEWDGEYHYYSEKGWLA